MDDDVINRDVTDRGTVDRDVIDRGTIDRDVIDRGVIVRPPNIIISRDDLEDETYRENNYKDVSTKGISNCSENSIKSVARHFREVVCIKIGHKYKLR